VALKEGCAHTAVSCLRCRDEDRSAKGHGHGQRDLVQSGHPLLTPFRRPTLGWSSRATLTQCVCHRTPRRRSGGNALEARGYTRPCQCPRAGVSGIVRGSLRLRDDLVGRDNCTAASDKSIITHPACIVVTPRNNPVPSNLDTPHRLLVTQHRPQQLARLQVPHADRPVPRSRHCDRFAIEDLDTSDSGRVAVHRVDQVAAYQRYSGRPTRHGGKGETLTQRADPTP
jgi:hypothetical protein